MSKTSKITDPITTADYQIAGLWCQISFQKPVLIDKILISFVNFRCNANKNTKFVCKIKVNDNCQEVDLTSSTFLTEAKGIIGDCVQLYENEHGYITIISFENDTHRYTMVSNKNFSMSTIDVRLEDVYAENILSSFFMVAFSQMAVRHNTILIHASVVERYNEGFAFLGKSGTGKSTHSSLWLQYIEGTTLLNDDNPAIQIDSEGNIVIWGTPWSGKTPCYQNKKVNLKALVRLQQAAENKYNEVHGSCAMIALLPSCSSLRWNASLYSSLCDILEQVIAKTPIAVLQCLPNKKAAELCFNKIDIK